MATNVAVDAELVAEAMRLGKHKSKRAAVAAALDSYVKARLRVGIKDLIGKVEYYNDYDH